MPHTEGHEEQQPITTLAALEQLWMQGAAQQQEEAQDVIGGYYAFDDVPIGPLERGRSTREAYKAGDDMSMISKMNTEQLARFQNQAVASGLVPSIVPGRIDDNTVNAMNTLMALGNRQGVAWQHVLDGVVQAGGIPGAQPPEFEEQPYLAPDHQLWAQQVKNKFRQALGRDPDDGELAEFVGELQGWDKANFEVQQDAREAAHEGRGGVFDADAIDPLARFHETFEKVYSGELEFVEDKEEAVQTQGFTEGTVNRLSTMSRGEF